MTELIEERKLDQLQDLIVGKKIDRGLLFAGIDKRYLATLPVLPAPADQIRSDLGRLNALPYLAIDPASSIMPPLHRYLKNVDNSLAGLLEEDAVKPLIERVTEESEPVVRAVGELLSALAAAHPLAATIADLSETEIEPDTEAWTAWAIALHGAAERNEHGQLVEHARDAAAGDARSALAACYERRTDWLGAVAAAAAVHVHLRAGVAGPGRRVTWPDIVEAARAVTKSIIDDLSTLTDAQVAITRDQIRIDRPRLEEVRIQFEAGDASVLVLVGDSGVGKTTLVMHWASELERAGHAVVLLTGARLRPAEVWNQVGADLGQEGDPDAWLRAVGEAATNENRQLFVIIDGANEYLDDAVTPSDLFEHVNRQLDDLPASVRIIMTFSRPTWRRVVAKAAGARRIKRYFGALPDSAIPVPEFDDDELERAWQRCQEVFAVGPPLSDLPALLRAQMHNPALMVLTATTFAGDTVPVQEMAAAADIFQRYYDTRTRESPDPDRDFLSDVSLSMYKERQSPIPTRLLGEVESLREQLRDDPDSVYTRMLDNGVLRRVDLPRFRPPDSVEYTVNRFGAWVLAGALQLKHRSTMKAIDEARTHIEDFPPIVDTIRILLSDRYDRADLAALADDDRPLMRELVVDALAELSYSAPGEVKDVVATLISGESSTEAQRRTGLWAAFAVTATTSELDLTDLFVEIGRGDDEQLREDGRDVLYLIWRTHPTFTYGVLDAMADHVPAINLLATRRLLNFMGDLSITIYTNHPGWKVGVPTSELWHKVAVDRIHLKLLDALRVPQLVMRVANRVFSPRILDGFLLNDPAALPKVFDLPAAEKEPLRAGVELLEPDADISSAANVELLVSLFGSQWEIFRLVAAQALAVHAVHDFEAAEPAVAAVFPQLDRDGKLWVINAFSVLLDETPGEWATMLEQLVETTVREHPELGTDESLGYLGDPLALDQLLFSLALADAKQRSGMPALDRLIDRGLTENEPVLVGRCIDVVGRVGFYHPQPALDLVRAHWDRIGDPTRQEPRVSDGLSDRTIRALGAIRMLYRDLVDDFHLDVDASAEWRRAVVDAEQSKPNRERIRAQVLLLGLYNNGVHQAVCFPYMRHNLLKPIYLMLCNQPDLGTATKQLTKTAWRMFRDVEFDLSGWAEPPCADGPCR